MSITAKQVSQFVDTELEFVSDVRVIDHVRSLLVVPQVVQRLWNYGEPDTKYPCWSVLQHESSNTEIAYSEFGFGPTYPWGLVFMSGSEDEMAMGMDSAWFPCFMETYFESRAACALPIWRVFSRVEGAFPGNPISEEMSWDEVWKRVYELRESDPSTKYDCHHSIEYRKSDI